jgi:hypothetical protein
LNYKDAIKPARKALKTRKGLLSCVIGVFLTLSACTSSANIDEIFIKGHFRIPDGTKLLYRISTPESAGLFGRENLLVKAEYQFTDAQYDEFIQRAQVKEGWQPLPIAELLYLHLKEVDRFGQVDFKGFDRIKNGFYVCETTSRAGIFSNDPKVPTAFFRFPPATPDKDFVLGVLDSDKKILYVILKQDY